MRTLNAVSRLQCESPKAERSMHILFESKKIFNTYVCEALDQLF